LNLETETSLLLIEELARRGHTASTAELGDLFLNDAGAGVRAQIITVDMACRPFYRLAEPVERPIGDFDVVLMRKDPPVDADYIAATYVLERAAAAVPVVNDPTSLRVVNEKLWPLAFAPFAPPTLVSNDVRRLQAFAETHGRIVLKPLEDCSGRGVQFVDAADAARVIGPYVAARRHGYVMAQKFLAGVAAGDKRI